MGFRCGIVGLPNVGKSTLFNALTMTQAAEAANYPFTTIEPNIGRVAVPDPRLEAVAECAGAERVVPAQLTFVDIAGLVRGASKGEGLGNKFLGHVREVDAIVHVLRCFEDPDISHVSGGVDPVSDADVVETELVLADWQVLEHRHEALVKQVRGGDKTAAVELDAVALARGALGEGRSVRDLPAKDRHLPGIHGLNLLSAKPQLFVCNVEESAAADGNVYSQRAEAWAAQQKTAALVIAAALEAEITALEEAEERAEFLADAGLAEPGLNRMIKAGYRLLDLISFFTANENEAHAWTIANGATAVDAAGHVHTDMARGFIRAETIAWNDLIARGGEAGAREAGELRLEGREYHVRDGEVLRFRFSV